ncbi:MAG: helix-hairpin-helix domain-containing protein [Patescibacteria group bacterium]
MKSLDELNNFDPDELYVKLCEFKHTKVDRCMLYVFRCIKYFLNEKNPVPELLKWRNWKD